MSTTLAPKNLEAAPSSPPDRSGIVWTIQAFVTAVLLVVAFWPILVSMYGSWFDEHSYMEHGILVVPAALYMVWTKRQRLMQVPRKPSAWGILLMFWGAMQAMLGLAAHWIWAGRISFLISLVGALVSLYGFKMVRELAYPLCTMILMIAPPTFVYANLTLSLQLLASKLGEAFLEVLGYSVVREGNILELVGTKLSVEEACSGIRSLFSILFMCALYDYFFVSDKWMRTIILVMATPVAILGNAGRIVATGIASQYNRELVQGSAHEAFGYVSVVLAGAGCVALHVTMVYLQKAWRSHSASRHEAA